MTASLLVVLTTFDDQTRAREVGLKLVEERLVACAQVEVAAVHSVWRWKGEVESGQEWRLTLKLSPERLEVVRARLHELHSYETPQFVVLAASASDEYARWVRDACS
jgi:periplasmic divalent cation tolerance protein